MKREPNTDDNLIPVRSKETFYFWRCTKRKETIMDDKDKIIAFLAGLIRKLIHYNGFTPDEMQALDNIIDDLPDVDAKEFRW